MNEVVDVRPVVEVLEVSERTRLKENADEYPKIPAGRRTTVDKPFRPLAAMTSRSAIAFVSLYTSIATVGYGVSSVAFSRSSPVNTTPAELVNTSFGTFERIAASMTFWVPSTFTRV
jgi:hypothetical protein